MGVSNYELEWNEVINNTATIGRLLRCPHDILEACPPTQYRSLSGYCNNVQNPLYGAATEPMQRLTPNAYFDGLVNFLLLNNKKKFYCLTIVTV